nr:EOG090X0IC1 [Megafenestra aurita]
MSLNIVINESDLASKDNCELHLMPCKINYNGSANVKEFFCPQMHPKVLDEKATIGSSEILEGSFRGFPLQGKKLVIPTSYKGVVISETRKPLTDVEERNFNACQSFNQLTYWNWDMTPTDNDSIFQMLDWLELSQKESLD